MMVFDIILGLFHHDILPNQDPVPLAKRFQFIFIAPILRSFSLLKRVRHLMSTIVALLPFFYHMFIILLCLFYGYAVYGVYLFHDLHLILEEEWVPGSFDNLSQAFITLYQILMGDMLAENVYAGVLVTHWSVVIYYVSFILLVSVLFRGLISGAIISIWQQVVHTHNLSRAHIKRKLLEDR